MEESLSKSDVDVLCCILERTTLKLQNSLESDIWRDCLKKSFLVLRAELQTKGTFENFRKIVREKLTSESPLKDSVRSLRCEYHALKRNAKENGERREEELRQLDEEISKARENDKESLDKERMEAEYAEKLYETKTVENRLECEKEERILKEEIRQLKQKYSEEREIHQEIVSYYTKERENLELGISEWNKKLEEIDRCEEEIKNLTSLLKDENVVLNYYKHKYETRKVEIEEWSAEKERREKEDEMRRKEEKSATYIQAWWRGVMVRRFIGVYKRLLKLKSRRNAAGGKKGSKSREKKRIRIPFK